MANIAWYGAGLMGSAFVKALCARGDNVAVYNRTFEKARALERYGARAERDPRAAASGASRVHVIASDDDAVDALLATLEGALTPGTTVIDHSTVAPAATAARALRLEALGFVFLHAPVFMSPLQASEGRGSMLVAGPRSAFDAVRTDLARMTGEVLYVGERADKAAALKLLGNAVRTFIAAGLADVFALGRSLDVAPAETLAYIDALRLADSLGALGARFAGGDTAVGVALTTTRKDVRLMLESAERAGRELHVLAQIAKRMDALIASGHGAEDVSVLARTLGDAERGHEGV